MIDAKDRIVHNDLVELQKGAMVRDAGDGTCTVNRSLTPIIATWKSYTRSAESKGEGGQKY